MAQHLRVLEGPGRGGGPSERRRHADLHRQAVDRHLDHEGARRRLDQQLLRADRRGDGGGHRAATYSALREGQDRRHHSGGLRGQQHHRRRLRSRQKPVSAWVALTDFVKFGLLSSWLGVFCYRLVRFGMIFLNNFSRAIRSSL